MTVILSDDLDPTRAYLVVYRAGDWTAQELDPAHAYLLLTEEGLRVAHPCTVGAGPRFTPRSWIQYIATHRDDLGKGPAV